MYRSAQSTPRWTRSPCVLFRIAFCFSCGNLFGHSLVFFLWDCTALKQITIEIIKPHILCHAFFALFVSYNFPHPVTSFFQDCSDIFSSLREKIIQIIKMWYYKLCSYSYFFLSLCSGMVVQSSTAGLSSNIADRSPTKSAMPVVMEITVFRLMFCNAR